MKKIICCLATLAVAFGALSAVTFVKANAETTPAFKGVSVSLNENIVLKFEVENYTEGYTLTFKYKNKEYKGEVKNGVAEFAYVTPQYLGETVTATLTKDGETPITYKDSVKNYLYNLVRAEKTAEEFKDFSNAKLAAMKTLAVDMLEYGAAAQTKYLEATAEELVTAKLTDEEKALATKFVAPAESAQATLSGTQAGYEWVSAGIRFDYNVSLYFVIKPLTENAVLKLQVTDKDGNNEVIDRYIVENGNYKYRYENVNVVDFANKYTVKVLDEKDKEIGQTLTYSVNTYVLNKYNDDSMGDITQAVYNYGVSAKAYVAACNVKVLTTPVDKTFYIETKNGSLYAVCFNREVNLFANDAVDYILFEMYKKGDADKKVLGSFKLTREKALVTSNNGKFSLVSTLDDLYQLFSKDDNLTKWNSFLKVALGKNAEAGEYRMSAQVIAKSGTEYESSAKHYFTDDTEHNLSIS